VDQEKNSAHPKGGRGGACVTQCLKLSGERTKKKKGAIPKNRYESNHQQPFKKKTIEKGAKIPEPRHHKNLKKVWVKKYKC